MADKKQEPTPQVELKNLLEGLSTTNNESGELPPSSSIELTHEIVETMFDEGKIQMITDLSELEIRGILKLSVINDIVFDGKKSVLSKMSNTIMKLKVSKNRGGRREMIKAIYASGSGMIEEPVSRFKRYIG